MYKQRHMDTYCAVTCIQTDNQNIMKCSYGFPVSYLSPVVSQNTA